MMEAQPGDVPGTVVHHTPAASGRYNGCPSIVVLPSGDLLASHSYFGPNSAQRNSFIYSSSDGGVNWERGASLGGQIWSTLFRHRGELYIFDPETATYFALVNPQAGTVLWRNKLSLSISPELKKWRVLCDVLYHPDTDFHAFQYVDWDFDGDDIVFLSRTAHEDGLGGAHNAHDANYITFHRVNKFIKATTNEEPIVKADFRKII